MTDCDPCAGLRAQIDIHERRIEELESENGVLFRQNAVLMGETDDLKTDLFEVMETLGIGRELVIDLIKRHFEDGDDFDAQLARVREWALYPETED